MAKITQKGITPFAAKETIPPELYTYLQQLQMRFPDVSTYSVTLNPGNINANSELIETYSVPGLSTNDIVKVNPPTNIDSGLGIMMEFVSAADTLSIRWRNFTGGGINPASGVYKILAVRL